jgi:large conductance mechanosensitive channel
MKNFFAEFRKFAMKGNVIDLAVGVVIGAAFGKIVSSFVANIVMPPLNLLTARYGMNFSNLALTYKTESPKLNEDGTMVLNEAGDPELVLQAYPILKYGPFIQTVIDFLIVAIAIFIAIKIFNRVKERFEEQKPSVPVEVPEDIQLLREIRDSLKAQQG